MWRFIRQCLVGLLQDAVAVSVRNIPSLQNAVSMWLFSGFLHCRHSCHHMVAPQTVLPYISVVAGSLWWHFSLLLLVT